MDVAGLIIYEEAQSPSNKRHRSKFAEDFIPWLCVCRTNLINKDLCVTASAFATASEYYFGKDAGDILTKFPGVVSRVSGFCVAGYAGIKSFFSNTERLDDPKPLFAADADQLRVLRQFLLFVLENKSIRPSSDGSIACHLLFGHFRDWCASTGKEVSNELMLMEWMHVLGIAIQAPTTSTSCWRWDFSPLYDPMKAGQDAVGALFKFVGDKGPATKIAKVLISSDGPMTCKHCGKTGSGVYKVYSCKDLYLCHTCIKTGPLLSQTCSCGAASQARHLKRYSDRFVTESTTSVCKRCQADVDDRASHIITAHNIKTKYAEHTARLEEITKKRKRLQEELNGLVKEEEALVKSKKESEIEMDQDIVYFFGE